MTDTIELKSNLVMPTIGYELNREEMTYVDGGGTYTYRSAHAKSQVASIFAPTLGHGAGVWFSYKMVALNVITSGGFSETQHKFFKLKCSTISGL